MPTARELITRSLGLIGVVEASETPTAADLDLGFTLLNELLEDWSLQRQTISTITRVVVPLSAGVATYTIGPGGTINVARPHWIDGWSVLPDAGVDQEVPMGTPLTLRGYQTIPMKTTTGAYPTSLYYDGGTTNGRGTLTVYPVPATSTPALVLYLPTPLAAFPDLSTSVTLAAGVARALRYGLAVELAPHFDAIVPPTVATEARLALAALKRANYRLRDAGLDPALTGTGAEYDIYVDQ